jgi:radical SAM protein with 4Fe4S-binding SPASM domain
LCDACRRQLSGTGNDGKNEVTVVSIFELEGNSCMIAIFSRVRLNRKQVISVVLFTLLATISQMMIPLLVSFMINDGVSGNKVGLIILLGFVMIGLAVLSCVLSSISAGITASITTGFCGELRKEIFHKVESFSAADLDRFGTSSLITRNTTDVTMIQTFLSMALRMGLLAPMMAAVGLVLCVVSAGKVSVVLVIAIPLLILGIAILTIAASRYSVRLRSRIDDINQLFLEALEGVRVIRAFNRQGHEMGRFNKTNEETADISRKSIMMSGAFLYEKSSDHWGIFYHRECPADQEDKRLSCPVLGESFYIGADGVVAPCQGMCDCDFGKNFPTLKEKPLREILTDSDYVKLSYATVGDVRRGNDACRTCEFIDRCAGSCRNSALLNGDNYYGVDPDACYFFKNGWEERIRAVAQLAFDVYIKRCPPKVGQKKGNPIELDCP